MRKIVLGLGVVALGAGACASGPADDAGSGPADPGAPASTASSPAPNTRPPTTITTTTSPATTTTTSPAATTTTIITTTTTTSTMSPATTTAMSPTTTTTMSPTATPTAAVAPARVGFGGDSIGLGMLPALQTALEFSGHEFRATWFVGFSHPDSVEQWETLLAEPADVVVFAFAPWEMASVRDWGVVDLSDPRWPDVYRTTYVEPRIAQVLATGADIVWVSAPPSPDPDQALWYLVLNDVWRQVAAADPRITWIDAAGVLLGPDGFVEVDRTVEPAARLFKPDRRHLCPDGGQRLSAAVLDVLADLGVGTDPSWDDGEWRDNPLAYGESGCDGPTT